MKNFILIILYIIFPTFLFAQLKTDKIKTSEIYLNTASKKIKFDDIHPQTIVKLLGKPLHILREKSEVTEQIVVTYSYKEGDIDFEGNEAAFIEIKTSGWGFSFARKNLVSKPLFIGDESISVKKIFPYLILEKPNNFYRLWLVTNDGTVADVNIVFKIANNKIKEISYFSDES